MKRRKKMLDKILRGVSDANIRFEDLRSTLLDLGFEERIHGSHHIFTKADVEEILNLQPKNAKAKIYQVKQVRALILKYRLAAEDEGAEDDEENDNPL